MLSNMDTNADAKHLLEVNDNKFEWQGPYSISKK
jgi:hypothetical protein